MFLSDIMIITRNFVQIWVIGNCWFSKKLVGLTFQLFLSGLEDETKHFIGAEITGLTFIKDTLSLLGDLRRFQ